MEHHANLVPWQQLCERTGATLRWLGLTDDGQLDLSQADRLIDEKTKVVAFTWVSNMLGTINPVAEITRFVHERGARDITCVTLLCAPEGLKALEEQLDPAIDLTVVTAAIDEKLNEKGYIVPGLGDAGDRLYGVV